MRTNVTKKTHVRILAAAGVLVLMVLPFFLHRIGGLSKTKETASENPGRVGVVHVIDGDTVTVVLDDKTRTKLRLIGIDAPEMGQRPWGERARKHLSELIDASKGAMTLEYDVEKYDKYGRLLGYLRDRDGNFINLLMLRDGYAVTLSIEPNIKYAVPFSEAEAEARSAKVGIWGRKGLRESPREYKRKHQSYK